MKITTIRLPTDLDREWEEYAKKEDLSKNQVAKKALRKLLREARREGVRMDGRK